MRLDINNFTVGYGSHVVQSGINASLSSGQMACLLGANGCGKSTLLRSLAAMQKPLSGSVTIDGTPLTNLTDQQRATTFSLVLTERILMERTTVRQLVALGRTPYMSWNGAMSADDWNAVDQAINLVGIEHLAQKQVNAISDGERQRVMIARAFAQDTPVMLLDEPTTYLDLPNRIEIMRLLQQLAHRQNKIVLVSTHEIDIALHVADVVWIMDKQSPMICDTPDNILAADLVAKAFPSALFHFDTTDKSLKYDF